jgi:hypothetical protein
MPAVSCTCCHNVVVKRVDAILLSHENPQKEKILLRFENIKAFCINLAARLL